MLCLNVHVCVFVSDVYVKRLYYSLVDGDGPSAHRSKLVTNSNFTNICRFEPVGQYVLNYHRCNVLMSKLM